VNFKKMTTVLAVAGAMFIVGNANATNWLKLQGTEDPGSGARARVWGFLQPTYQKDVSPGTTPEPTRIGGNLNTQEQFQLFRARVGVRGTALPLDDNVNYFIMWEGGNNAATDGGYKYGVKTPMRLMDASVTLNNIPHARIRAGLFKTPGSEEVFQGIPALDYINFTWVGNQLLLERYANGVNCDPNTDPTCNDGTLNYSDTTGWNSDFGAARDTGVQVFDWFRTGDWEHSYAVMYGSGSGLEPYNPEVVPGKHDLYLYWSSELVYGGKGPFQQGWKTYVWSQTGKRQIDLTDNNTYDPTVHDRDRSGIGTRYRRGDWRLQAEYITGKGMIFEGPEKPTFGYSNPALVANTVGLDGKANGYYLDAGYYVPSTPWELDARYDVYNRDTESAVFAIKFQRTTLGVQYHLNKKSKVMFNYEIRSATATGASAPPPLKANLAEIGNRYGIQITTIF
jgi:hypothetical protein